MNMYVWSLPGFYANGVIAIQGYNEIFALNKLYYYDYDLWRQIQVGISYRDKEFESLLKSYCLDNFAKIKPHIDKIRKNVINDPRNGKTCIDFYTQASDIDIFEKSWTSLSNYVLKDFLLEQIDDVTKTTKWYIKPQEITTYFYQRASD